jgi:hypothetical protein
MRWAVLGGMAVVFLGASAAWADPGPRGLSQGVSVASRAAQQPAAAPSVEVLVIEATTGDGGVAPVLANIPQLRQAPLNTFAQMRMVSRNTVALGPAAATTALPGNRSATITLASRSPENRYTVNVAFSTGGSIQFVAGAGEPFFTVRASRPDRAIILGFIVRHGP